jgi:iron complex outermembrane receptor protein
MVETTVDALRGRCSALLLALSLLPALALPAVAAEGGGGEEGEEEALLALLAQETEIATKSRMNSDYVPGIVTVLAGDELEALGVETVLEALALVPGIQPVRTIQSQPSTLVRGIQFPFNSGNVKILLDGVPLSRQSSGINGSILLLPIEQVDRIEVIRGPGSVIYGDFAFMGLLNIVSRTEGSRVHVRADSDDLRAGGARLAWGEPASPWQLTANLATAQDDDADLEERRRGDSEQGSALLTLRRGGFSLLGQLIQRDVDDAPRVVGGPPGSGGVPAAFDETTWAVEGRWERELRPSLSATARLSVLQSDTDGFPFVFEDRVDRVGLDLTWDGWRGHSWLAGAEYAAQEIRHASATPPPGLGQPLSLDGKERKVSSLVLQDRVDLGERWTLTGGARYDHYSDVTSRITPRLSVVWRASERHIVKAQYAEGFRAPTFFEAYTRTPTGSGVLNRDLDFEVNQTTELNYVYRRPTSTARVTLFRSRLVDMLFTNAPRPGSANSRAAQAEGVEVEWNQQLAGFLKLLASASWVDTEDNRGPTLAVHESEAAADWTGDLALLAQLGGAGTAAVHWYHVGDRPALAGDHGYDLVDVTFSSADLWRGLAVKAGVRNALDDDLVYLTVPPNGQVAAATFTGRTAWAQLSWSW